MCIRDRSSSTQQVAYRTTMKAILVKDITVRNLPPLKGFKKLWEGGTLTEASLKVFLIV